MSHLIATSGGNMFSLGYMVNLRALQQVLPFYEVLHLIKLSINSVSKMDTVKCRTKAHYRTGGPK